MVGILALTAAGAFAQRGEKRDFDPEKVAEKHALKMKEDLGLSEDQYKQVLALDQARAEKIQVRREAMKAQREQMKAEHESFEKELKNVLTEEQYKALEAKRAERHEQFKERRGDRGSRRPYRDGMKPKN